MRQTKLIKDLLLRADEKTIAKIAAGTFVALGLLLYPWGPYLVRAAAASAAMSAALYWADKVQTFKAGARTAGVAFVTITAWHYAAAWLGTGWIGIALLTVGFLAYRAYRMRSWVKIWWAGYKQSLRRAWRGEGR